MSALRETGARVHKQTDIHQEEHSAGIAIDRRLTELSYAVDDDIQEPAGDGIYEEKNTFRQ